MTTISNERLAEMVGAGVPCVPAQPGEIAAVVQELRALRASSGVEVKGLEWRKVALFDLNDLHVPDYKGIATKVAESIVGTYAVVKIDGGRYAPWLGKARLPGLSDTEAEAKAAAEADCRQRILSCLSSPLPTVEVTEEMVGRLIEFATDVGRSSPKTVPMGANPPLFDGMQDDTDGAWLNRVGVAKRIRSFFAAALSQNKGAV